MIPPPHEPYPDEGRGGVPFEEDLAIRALDPKLKPKRGRRKNDEDEEDDDDTDMQPQPKRPQLDTSVAYQGPTNYTHPQSAYPSSAHPDDMDRFVSQHDPWTTMSTITPASSLNARNMTPHSAQHLRWRLNTQDTPQSPHPMSAITPSTSHPPDSAFDEPQSAVTPGSSRARSRRRHGPAVSSAWPSTGGSATGKLRGRPPSNRSVRDGPFVTFPANPKTKEGPTIDLNRSTPGPTPVDQTPSTATTTASDSQRFRFPPTPASAMTPASAISNQSRESNMSASRPERLQVQVPQHVGNPVRLVTPTLLVNGQTNTPASTVSHVPTEYYDQSAVSSADPRFAGPTSHPQPQPQYITQIQSAAAQSRSSNSTPILSPFPTLTHESLKRALAHDLLRADITGSRKKLRGTEAKELADALLKKLRTQHNVQSPTTPGSTGTAEQVHRMSMATILNLSSALGLPGPPSPVNQKKLFFQRFRVGGDGYDSPIDEDEEDEADGDAEGEGDADSREVRETVDVAWTTTIGALVAECKIKGIVANGVSQDTATEEKGSEEEDWKKRYEGLMKKMKRKEDEVRELREKVLEAVM